MASIRHIIFFLIVVFLFSCKAETSESKKKEAQIDLIPKIDSLLLEERELEQERSNPDESVQMMVENHIKIESPFLRLKGSYIALSYQDGRDPFIYHFCEAEDPSVIIDTYEAEKRFIIGLGQDSEIYYITSIDGETYEKELYQVADYKISLTNFNKSESLSVTALINEDDGTSFFEGLESLHAIYVREDHAKDVEHISEDCDYLNDY